LWENNCAKAASGNPPEANDRCHCALKPLPLYLISMSSEESRKEKSLRYSIKDGVFVSMMNGFTVDYLTPFLLLLGGTVRHVAALSALPHLFSSIIQIKSPDVMEKLRSRKKLIKIFILLQALMLLPMTATFFMGSYRVAVFIAVVTLFTAFGAFLMPAWGSLMTDLVAEDRRGEYFGWRNRVLGTVAIVATFIAGFILHQAERVNALWGFIAIFGAAFIFRLVSWLYMARMHEPELERKEEDYFSFRDFISGFKTSNFARFVGFVAATKFSVNIASPFFAVFMLKDLKFGYMTYALINLASTATAILINKRWGVHSDRAGNLKVLRITSYLVSFIPLLWLINQNAYYLFFIQMFSGFAWAGFNLSASNFIYDSSTPGQRARCIAYFNACTGIALFLGALTGGWLAERVPAGFFEFPVMNIILISALMRFMIAFFVPFKLKEVRQVEPVRIRELVLRVLSLKPLPERER